jgi:hypothetical protein
MTYTVQRRCGATWVHHGLPGPGLQRAIAKADRLARAGGAVRVLDWRTGVIVYVPTVPDATLT